MPKVNTAMQGVFRDMLADYLKLVGKEGGQSAAREGGQKAGKEIAEHALKQADEVIVPFKLTKEMSDHKAELARQLDRQLKHFDGMTPNEILKKLDPEKYGGEVVERTGKAQRDARKRFTQAMQERQNKAVRDLMKDPKAFKQQLKDFGVDSTGNPFKDAEALAKARTDGFMKTVAALHEPDIIAGGIDDIGKHSNGLDSFGLSNVNSSIGSQWKNVKPDLITLLEGMDPNTPIRLGHPIR